jgi:hypothetical protein
MPRNVYTEFWYGNLMKNSHLENQEEGLRTTYVKMDLGETGCKDGLWMRLVQDCDTTAAEPYQSVRGRHTPLSLILTSERFRQLLAHHSIPKNMTSVSIQYQLYGFSLHKHFFLDNHHFYLPINSKMRWARHVAHSNMRNANKILARKPEEKRQFGRPSCRQENNKLHLKEKEGLRV